MESICSLLLPRIHQDGNIASILQQYCFQELITAIKIAFVGNFRIRNAHRNSYLLRTTIPFLDPGSNQTLENCWDEQRTRAKRLPIILIVQSRYLFTPLLWCRSVWRLSTCL